MDLERASLHGSEQESKSKIRNQVWREDKSNKALKAEQRIQVSPPALVSSNTKHVIQGNVWTCPSVRELILAKGNLATRGALYTVRNSRCCWDGRGKHTAYGSAFQWTSWWCTRPWQRTWKKARDKTYPRSFTPSEWGWWCCPSILASSSTSSDNLKILMKCCGIISKRLHPKRRLAFIASIEGSTSANYPRYRLQQQ